MEILEMLKNDPSIHVRKSVGNNIKDLTKYMPEKMIKLMKSWINESAVEFCDELATEIGLNKEEKNLIYIIKHEMRWLKERKPKYHPQMEKLLGKYYVLYFDEKKNKLARPHRIKSS